MQQQEPETQDVSFGEPLLDKFVVSAVAIDLVLLQILLTSGKLDVLLSTALDAVSISLPAAGWYLTMRLLLSINKSAWELIHDYHPRYSRITKFFFFNCLPLVALMPCLYAGYSMIEHVSLLASNIFLFVTVTIGLFFALFTFLIARYGLGKKKRSPHVQ